MNSSWLRVSGNVAAELLANITLPYVVYVATVARLGDVGALLAASLPPIAWSLVQFIRSRRLDAVSLLVLAGIALSLLAFVGSGSAKLLQLRENLVTGAIGVVFLGSAAIGRPLIYQLALAGMSRRSAAEAADFTSRKDIPGFRHSMIVMTLVWGVGLLAQTSLACLLVYTLPIATYLAVSPVVGYGAMGGLALWTFWYAGRRRRQGEAARAAALRHGGD